MRATAHLLFLLPLILAPLQAQELLEPPGASESLRGRWSMVLGAQAMAVPAYEGSDQHRLLAVPLISGSYDGRYYFGASQIGVGVGGGLHLVQRPGFSWNLGMGVGDRRPEGRADALAGMGNRAASLWTGTTATWRWDAFRLGLSLAQGLRGDEGTRLSLNLGHALPIAPGWTLGTGLQASWSSARNMRYDFGIEAEQAARRAALWAAGDRRLTPSDLGPYTPGAGIRSLGATLYLGYSPAPRWQANLFLRGSALQGDAKASPLTPRDSALMGGLGFARRF